MTFSRLKFDFLYFFVWKNQKMVITFYLGPVDDFCGNFWRLHFYDLFEVEIRFFVFLCFKNLKKYGGGTKKKLNWIFIISSFLEYRKNCRYHHFFNNIQKKNSLGPFNRHKLNINFATENPSQIWLLLEAVFSF